MNSDPDKKLRSYTKFKTDFKIEDYLLVIKDRIIRNNITRFRISAHNLKIETGRHKRPQKIPLADRICEHCNILEDEIHIILYCSKFTSEREILFKQVTDIFPHFSSLDYLDKFIFLMNLDDYEKIKLIQNFLSKVVDIRGSF